MVDKEGHGIRDRVNELKYSAEKAMFLLQGTVWIGKKLWGPHATVE